MELEAKIIKAVVAWENQQSGPRLSNGELKVVPRTEGPESVELGTLSTALEGYRYKPAARVLERRQQDGSYTRIAKCELAEFTLGEGTVYLDEGSTLSPIPESVSDINRRKFISVFKIQDDGGR